MAVDKWKLYLQHQTFTISTDQKSLIHLNEQKLVDGMQHKAFVKLLGLQYRIAYKRGEDNKAGDALSRKLVHEAVHAISMSKPRWLEITMEGYHTDEPTKQLLTELSLTSANEKEFTLQKASLDTRAEFGWATIKKHIK